MGTTSTVHQMSPQIANSLFCVEQDGTAGEVPKTRFKMSASQFGCGNQTSGMAFYSILP